MNNQIPQNEHDRTQHLMGQYLMSQLHLPLAALLMLSSLLAVEPTVYSVVLVEQNKSLLLFLAHTKSPVNHIII